ncbi:hypothetical protein KJ855_03080 [Patescibacteria group bacterium]|nr:hypothetical protein [Patescibacteria group bacterium]
MKRIIKHLHHGKSSVRRVLHPTHCYMRETFGWYKWWHEQDHHRHIHYVAMFVGIIAAGYYLMLEEIFSKINL